MNRRTVFALAAAIALTQSSCDKNPVIDTATSKTTNADNSQEIPRSPMGPATTVALGEANAESIHASDQTCNELSGGYYYNATGVPCQRYLVNVPGAGTLKVHVEWSNSDNLLGLTTRETPFGFLSPTNCCSSPLDRQYTPSHATAYLIFVTWAGNRSGASLTADAAQDFTLTTSFAPIGNVGPSGSGYGPQGRPAPGK